MNITIELKKTFCTARDIATIIWQNMILAKELEFLYQTKVIGEPVRRQKELTIDEIIKTVCDYFNMPVDLLQSRCRKKEVIQARFICMYFAFEKTKLYKREIGEQIGKLTSSDVHHAHKTISNYIQTDRIFREKMEEIEDKLK